ncbi:MAG: response regulator [Azonexus sp.]|uniref:response regulator n=1 Tax=Azonexus sp. TaxID=1872668 RepID=UPI00282E1074|nr:response regulator [Azonexus sp.]MDR0777660.1 response regulator [Azonexus sp.]
MEQSCILVVDDEPISREILVENLAVEGYRVVEAASGEAAWQLIDATPERFEAILLDRMMPDMDGIEILRRVKQRADMRYVPVIMQTGMTADADVSEGLRAGAYYYLTKPFSADMLLAIVAAATRDYRDHRELEREAERQGRILSCLAEARFVYRTTDEARSLAALLANAAPEPTRVVLGLSELMLNAVEHGNLAISYQEKSQLIRFGRLQQEIASRLDDPRFAARKVEIEVRRVADELSFLIRDQGVGFDWHGYLEMRPERAFDTHGRGIAMSRMVSFDRLEYRGCGNEVEVAIHLAG